MIFHVHVSNSFISLGWAPSLGLSILFGNSSLFFNFSVFYHVLCIFHLVLSFSVKDSKNGKGRERLTFPRLNGFVGLRAAKISPELAKVTLLAG